MDTPMVKPNPGQAFQIARLIADGVSASDEIPKVYADAILATQDTRRQFTSEVMALIVRLGIAFTTVLELITTVDLPDLSGFKPHQFFVEKDQPDGIKFWLNEGFKRLLKLLPELETSVLADTVRVHRLVQTAKEPAIIATLGDNPATPFLARLAEFIKRQKNGEDGLLLTNGWANILVIELPDGTRWVVHADRNRDDRTWFLYAYPVSAVSEWCAGNQVFSR